MRRILIIILLLMSAGIARAQCLKADIILMIDWSGSQDSNRFYLTDAAFDFVQSLNLGPSSVKIGLIPFDTDPMCPFMLPLTKDKDLLLQDILLLRKVSPVGSTLFPSSLNLAQRFFIDSEAERKEEVLKVIIFISDGEEYYGMCGWDINKELTQQLASELKESGCYIWCINTSNNKIQWPIDHLKSMSSGPGYYIQRDYSGLKEELLRMQICP